jgi:8-oxo-dGTP pyrophosphatase MutT (NUDIX family)
MEPEYACAVIEDDRRRLLLQLRPATARHAAGLLTCFGGRREDGEDADACVRRELAEELHWQPTTLTPCCELWKGPRFIARFYRTTFTGGELRTEPGHHAVWAPWSALPGLPVSPWHAAVFAALIAQHDRVDLAL